MQAIVVSLILSAASARMIPRDVSTVEDIVLADCGIGTLPNPGDSASRQVFYYANGFKPTVQSDQAAEVVWDGSYPWRNTGVDMQLPNGEVFNIVINPDTTDDSTDYAGSAQHNDVKYLCQSNHGKDASTLPSGMKCTTAYICHRQAAAPAPAPQPKDVLNTHATISSMQAEVRVQGTYADQANWSPATVFAHIHEAIEGVQCKPASYSIGNDCKISFDCTFGNPNNVQPLTSVLTDAVTKVVEESKKTKIGHYYGSNCRPLEIGCIPEHYEFEYLVYTYPQAGTIMVTVEPEGHPELATIQSTLSWSTECVSQCGAFCGSATRILSDYMVGIVGLPPVAAIVCSFC
jgi:hypothetical protein